MTTRNGIIEHRTFVDALSRKSIAVEEPYREPASFADDLEDRLGPPLRREYDPTTDTNVLTFAL